MRPDRQDGTLGVGVPSNEDFGNNEARGYDYVDGRNAYRQGRTRVECPYKHGHRSYQPWMDGYSDAEQEAGAAHRAEQTLQLIDERIKEFLGGKHGSMTTIQLLDRVFAEIKLSTPVAEVTALEARIAALEALVRRGAGPVTVACRTNLDQFRTVRWPTMLACVPAIGDRIEGFEWNSNKVVAELRVCGITHARARDGTPYIGVELHR